MSEGNWKQCNAVKGCGEFLPLEAFYRCPNGKMGRQANCIQCLRAHSIPDDSCLYVMSNSRIPGEYKVGRSSNPEARAADLQAAHNFEMIIHAVFPRLGNREYDVHVALQTYRVHAGSSREWFKADLSHILQTIAKFLP